MKGARYSRQFLQTLALGVVLALQTVKVGAHLGQLHLQLQVTTAGGMRRAGEKVTEIPIERVEKTDRQRRGEEQEQFNDTERWNKARVCLRREREGVH